MREGHDNDCPCTRFEASWEFCNCEAGQYGNIAVNAEIPLAVPASRTGWRRKKGFDRKPGYRTLNRHTPARVHKFATTRLKDIAALLQEIELLYGDVDETIVHLCETVREHDLVELQTQVDERLRDDVGREEDAP